jgi:DNA polymerase elongation subunit (family B)
MEDKNGTERSIFGTHLKIREFQTLWARNKFVKEGNFKRTFENLPPYQQFLLDNYWMSNNDEEFSQHPLKVMMIDIETFSKGSFPDVETAPHVINLITCHDSLTNKKTTFGLGLFDGSNYPDVEYNACKSEEELLKKFLKYFTSDYPDVISGWNSSGFDFPYIINRITYILGEEWSKELSPVGRYYEKINKNAAKFGDVQKTYVVEGVSSVDYLVIYKKFALDKQESYKLDHIGDIELDERKVEYDGQLWELAQNDWQKFVEYNIQDVELLVKLDNKLKYMDLLRFLAYMGLCSMEKAIDTVPVVNGSIAVKARARGERIPTFIRPKKLEKNPGAYVAVPKKGISENIVSFDANSLYPSVMISLNLSPETKVGRVERTNDGVRLYHTSGRALDYTNKAFAEVMKDQKWSLSSNKFVFTQTRKGIMPEFLDELYSKRKEMKGKMIDTKKYLKSKAESLTDIEKIKLEQDIQRYNTFQHAYKINLNSVYGYMGNSYAPMGDDDIASAVTLTGQDVIKHSNDIYKTYLKNKFKELLEGLIEESVIYNDTDSCYVSLKLVDHIIPLKEGNDINPEFYALCDEIENTLNEGMSVWAIKNYKSIDPRFIFKRESICSSGVFLAKKYYVLHVLDDEGVKADKFKYVGVDVVKTTMPRAIKPYVKHIIEDILINKSSKTANALFSDAYEQFKKLAPSDIAATNGMNNYEKYASKCNGLEIGNKTPGHVKAAYYHNWLVDTLGLGGIYEKFRSGDKVKKVQVKTPNKYGIEVVAFKGKYPPEFDDIFKVDYEKIFEKIFYQPINRFYDSINWTLRKPSENVRIELEDLFGE